MQDEYKHYKSIIEYINKYKEIQKNNDEYVIYQEVLEEDNAKVYVKKEANNG